MKRIFLLGTSTIALVVLLCTCARDTSLNTEEIYLSETLHNGWGRQAQRFYYPTDRAAWERKMAAADSIWADEETGILTVLHDEVYYALRPTTIPDTPLVAMEPLPGFEPKFTRLADSTTVFFDDSFHRLTANIYSEKVLLGEDSVRIGIIQTTGWAFPWANGPFTPTDYLFLMLPRQEVIALHASLPSVGPVTDKTIFRVNRDHYVLRRLSDDRRRLTVERLPEGRGLTATAELNPNFRQMPVESLDPGVGKTFIRRTPGKQLAVYFTRLLEPDQEDVLRLDSAYAALPPAERERLDLVIVSEYVNTQTVGQTVGAMGLRLPVYVKTQTSCEGIDCYPGSRKFLLVDERGQMLSFAGQYSYLLGRLRAGEGDLLQRR